jgi:hypothetical protein
VGLAGCAATGSPAVPGAAPSAQIVMTDASTGFAVWPSGVRWIVLGTTDGWRTVQNRTPVAVPTDGGLVLAARDGQVAVGVLPYQQLTVSPVLRSLGSGRVWEPSQLPSALVAAPSSLSLSQHASFAVLADGSVVTAPAGSSTWTRVPGFGSTPDAARPTGVVFPDGRAGFVTAAGPGDHPVLFTTAGSGGAWTPVRLPLTSPGVAVALPPCLVGTTWVAPVSQDGRLDLFTAPTSHGPWTRGPDLAAPTTPLLACSSHRVWAVVHADGGDVLSTSAPGGAWTTRGSVGGRLSSLAPVSDSEAFAAGADPSGVVRITLPTDTTATTEPIPLPDWVATIGGASMRN